MSSYHLKIVLSNVTAMDALFQCIRYIDKQKKQRIFVTIFKPLLVVFEFRIKTKNINNMKKMNDKKYVTQLKYTKIKFNSLAQKN